MVLTRAGLKLKTISLMLVSKDYRKGMSDKKLFAKEDVTKDAREQAEIFNSLADNLRDTLNAKKPPKFQFILSCRKCDPFEECSEKSIKNPIIQLPKIREKLFTELTQAGIFSIKDKALGANLSDQQKNIWESIRSNKPYIADDFKKELAKIKWPAYYLDFETFATALPVYENVAPYETVVTQYSIHKYSAPGIEESHFEYLADPACDCRKKIAGNLIDLLKGKGSIIAYSGYEKQQINALSELCPDLAPSLDKLTERIVDLLQLIRDNYYHPDFGGSYSIKNVLPVMVPDMGYEDLEIGEGGTAAALFAGMAKGQITDPKEIAQIRKNLLLYCQRDTLAMVKLHERLLEL